MFPQQYEQRVQELLDKLYQSPSPHGTVNLLDILFSVSKASQQRKAPCLTPLERHLLKGALPHCVQDAKVVAPLLVTVDSDSPEVTNHLSLPRITDTAVHNEECAPLTFPTLKRFQPLPKHTCLTAISGPSSAFHLRSSAVLKGVGQQSDVTHSPSLVVTREKLEHVLLKLPRWAFWNQWTDDQRREIRDIATRAEHAEAVTTASRRHAACKYPGRRVDKNVQDGEPEAPLDRECTFMPKLRPYRPRYLLSRPGRAKDDPLALLRTYCKHFHAGNWIKEYEALVDDLRECTFHPNIHKYIKPSKEMLRPPADPFSGGDPFSVLKEQFEEEWEREKEQLEQKKKQPSPTSTSTQSPWIIDDEPGAPKYSGLRNSYHRRCLEGSLLPKKESCQCKAPACSCYGRRDASAKRSARPKPWALTLRDGDTSSSFSTNVINRRKKRAVVSKKEKRYYNYDWGKYIRLSGRHLIPVCIPDIARLEAILQDAAPPWDSESPPPTLVEWSAGRRRKGAVFTAKTPVEDYTVNEARNRFSVTQHGIATGELLPPLRVFGIRRDAVTDLEKRIIAAKPASSLSCIYK